jgi:TolB-like protein
MTFCNWSLGKLRGPAFVNGQILQRLKLKNQTNKEWMLESRRRDPRFEHIHFDVESHIKECETTMNTRSQLLVVQDQSYVPASAGPAWTHDEVREELRRILRSRIFVKSIRLSCFLSTAVEYLLAGKADRFKEYTVGTEVYGRSEGYNPTIDTIVRTEARRLRSKLKEYYAHPTGHRLKITLLAGSYVPLIEVGYQSQRDQKLWNANTMSLSNDDESLSLVVIPFNTKTLDPENQDLASNLEEDLTHELAQIPEIKVYRTFGDDRTSPEEKLYDWTKSRVRFALRGHVRWSNDGPSVQLQLTTIQGMIVWSERFPCGSLRNHASEIASVVSTASHSFAMHRGQTRPCAQAVNHWPDADLGMNG